MSDGIAGNAWVARLRAVFARSNDDPEKIVAVAFGPGTNRETATIFSARSPSARDRNAG